MIERLRQERAIAIVMKYAMMTEEEAAAVYAKSLERRNIKVPKRLRLVLPIFRMVQLFVNI